MLIAQITDPHVQTPGGSLDVNYDTAGHLERAVRHLNGMARRPDVVLLTGDTVEGGSPAEYERLRGILAALELPLYVVPGNHDDREAMRAAFAGDGYLPAEGFLQYAVEDLPVRLVGLDTLVPGEPRGWICQARLAWLDSCLAADAERPTVLFMHHPPFTVGMPAMDRMGLEGAGDLEKLVARHRQVRHVLCGHIHRPIAAAFGGIVATVAPSTAHQLGLELEPAERISTVMEVPAAALLLWDAEAGRLVHHLSPIPDRPRHVLYDDGQWFRRPLPEGFRRP